MNPEKFRYKSPEELKREEIKTRIKERGPEGEIVGGIVFEEEIEEETDSQTGEKRERKKRYIYIGNPYEDDPDIIKLETDATPEDIEAIKREIIPMKESFEILSLCAESYKMRHGRIFEGPTAVGKTFLVEKFTELLFGRGVKPLDFYCSGQTDVSELMARWVPAVETEEDKKRWNAFLDSKEGQKELVKIVKGVEKEKELSPDQRRNFIVSQLSELAKSRGIGIREWRLQLGAVPKSMGLTKNPDGTFSFDEQKGAGFILHIEEVGLAEPQIINALLKLRGKRGELTKFIQLWEDGGREIRAGEKWWLVMSTNPPEEYGGGREPLDPALIRGFDYKVLKGLSAESYRLAAEYYFTYKVGEKPQPKEKLLLDIHNHPEIGRQIADVIGVFHNEITQALGKGEKGRETRIIFTLDQMASLAQRLIFRHGQKENKETSYLDVAESLRRGIERYYFDYLKDKDLINEMKTALEDLLTGNTGKIEFEGEERTRKEILDILVERASLTEEEKQKQQEEIEEREKLELEQARFDAQDDAQDAVEKLLNNPDTPESIKNIFKGKL